MIKENKTRTIQIRIGEDDYKKLVAISFMMGTKPSSFARQLIQMSINASQLAKMPIPDLSEVNRINENNKAD